MLPGSLLPPRFLRREPGNEASWKHGCDGSPGEVNHKGGGYFTSASYCLINNFINIPAGDHFMPFTLWQPHEIAHKPDVPVLTTVLCV